jgi:hypothetical protein
MILLCYIYSPDASSSSQIQNLLGVLHGSIIKLALEEKQKSKSVRPALGRDEPKRAANCSHMMRLYKTVSEQDEKGDFNPYKI